MDGVLIRGVWIVVGHHVIGVGEWDRWVTSLEMDHDNIKELATRPEGRAVSLSKAPESCRWRRAVDKRGITRTLASMELLCED